LAVAVRVKPGDVVRFEEFLRVDLKLALSTVQHTVEDVKRFLESAGYVVSRDTIRDYLQSYEEKAAKTYNQQLTSLRRFVKMFLGYAQLIETFRLAPVDEVQDFTEVPTRQQLTKAFNALPDSRSKAIFLFLATTGIRKGELFALTKDKVNWNLRAVVPKHFTRKKRSGITFYNEEAEVWLKKYLKERKDKDPRVFIISDRQWRKIWKIAKKAAGVRITAKILRKWVSTELGELGVPDRFVDIFQGRAPRTVIAKHYTAKGIERLKRIYDKANLKVLTTKN
jgi:integrase